ncbi:hypothetical protein PGT21_000887 [Puccinia graminis f. sp. tritici]|uniref:Uncharacterized protein n=1 Tax=Puccinia graminis f. sp. tritici TaxID=56615 RepID=A0A5B0P1A8_PUCGR|nr:hypothetical protein PGT21_000887 [Puccinia graminis f. sp. tritici]KAA1134561.1 hypothetical protein PGTUg99_005873 [Puccinia graminis f. sp. tritici]
MPSSSTLPSSFIIPLIVLSLLCIRQCITSTSPSNRFSQAYPSGLVIQSSRPSTLSTLADSERVSLKQADYVTSYPDRHKLVPIVLGVMSKCPDAQICEDVFDKVLAEVADKVDVLVAYMGDIDPAAQYGVRCRHGDSECRGNIHQLCYRNRFPQLHDWWGFIQCENYAGLSRVGEEALAKSCAKVNLHDWDQDVKDCANGSQGRQLLYSSVQLSKHLRIQKSCSIFINNQLVCVHDGGWKDCKSGHEIVDFVKYIQHEYDLINTSS